MKLESGDSAPDFTLPDQNGAPVHLADRIRQNIVVLFFYPKDNSAGCTAEACSFRDSYEDFKDAGADVIGISDGTVEDKQKFAQKNRLPFTLVNDADGSVARAYGAQKGKGLAAIAAPRITYIIDRQGIVRLRFESRINMDAHVKESLKFVQSLLNEQVNAP